MTHTITNSNIIYQCLIIPKLVIVFSTQIQTIHAYYFQYYLYESKLSIFNDIRIASMSIGKVHPPGSRAWTLNYSAVWVFSQRAYFIKLLWRHELFPKLKWNSSIRSIAKDLGKWLDSWRIYLLSSTRVGQSKNGVLLPYIGLGNSSLFQSDYTILWKILYFSTLETKWFVPLLLYCYFHGLSSYKLNYFVSATVDMTSLIHHTS